ncbi:ATP synthase mitochondrial F1 complex assembly factor 1 [Biomphalaria pfeifferi]|uniref:ATP synthase mitochondrial F1 complex assembly factor 1 n=1 Tax=Biomphalaria pfeifferi TaxID=112525 RepID=A0AAD8AUC6_BIOPF|nr:ATP synthase mitochondrial F1 complex assembly factor 1 [Biomphalaria pfeifferi]
MLLNQNQSAHPSALFSTSAIKFNKENSNPNSTEIESNPFFKKYKSKLQHLQSNSPNEYEARIKDLADRLKPKKIDDSSKKLQPPQTVLPSEVAKSGVGMSKKQGLDSIMKMDLVRDKTAEEITQIWNEYHNGKDCVYAVLKTNVYQNLMIKAKECPVFVYAIPRNEGFEFILSQFDQNDVYFTQLSMFQLVRENAPPCLTLNHYTEFLEDKGIVLMSGKYDSNVLKREMALGLVQQMSVFYGLNSRYFELVYRFNYEPARFHYQELIDAVKALPQVNIK